MKANTLAKLQKQLNQAQAQQAKYNKILAKEKLIAQQKSAEQKRIRNLRSQLAKTKSAVRSAKFRRVGKVTSRVKSTVASPKTKSMLKKADKFMTKFAKRMLD